MDLPRIGVTLQHFGRYAGPEGIATLAVAAERLGFHSLSVSERLLIPVGPHWTNDAGLPVDPCWDSLEVLTWAAAHTRRIRLCTGILNTIFQPPVVLARKLATLDRLSRGRLDVGIGQGGGTRLPPYYIPEEFTAAGVPVARRGAGFAEHVAAMRACWAPDPVEFHGEHYTIPASKVGPKPHGRIPLLFGAITRPTIERAARIGDGFVLVAVDWDAARQQIRWYREAGGTGTVMLSAFPTPPGTDPADAEFTDAVLADLDRAADAGADEMHVVTTLLDVSPERQVELLEALAARTGPS
ncbi:TIGR03619 family F420-dependent LLM class oxidoreductase [Actinomadura sp. NEAU-AAG7]|uniref:TIGR03619 family F420-dependent LLM class oxidoreductase n=1 Tax=Actinomadura sp. NEAU-AAG7 TaxID=2839640 RepID=UPI001BE413BD|nr:TIGR03619 family F420-dependent LLM class oxidoreductase [Actinomadura sp. NEAU-AAG7]MBT2213435.1 TIGR03619 family F420-dependent LLM class oxidoreductase [Actinomadura sp. NEAU-AAG7]